MDLVAPKGIGRPKGRPKGIPKGALVCTVLPQKWRVQSVAFAIEKWTQKKAEKWLNEHGYHPIKQFESTKNFFRYRILDPNKNFTYRVIKLPNNINLTLVLF